MMPLNFPPSFRFGVADSDLQVIGESKTRAHEGSEPTMWGECASKSDNVYQRQTPAEGIDRFSRYGEDIELLADLGVRDYRTSISMARLIRRDGSPNQNAVDWYRRYFGAIKSRGIRLHATLYHWELPDYLHQQGGWTNRRTIDAFVRHAAVAFDHLNEFIDEYHLINEHVCAAFFGYHLGIHAPFEKDFRAALLAGHHLLLAQGRAFETLKERDPAAKISTVCNPCPTYALTASENDLRAQALQMAYNTYWFIDPLFTGEYPAEACAAWERYLPPISSDEMRTIRIGKDLSGLGVNYYCGMTVTHDPNAVTEAKPLRPDFAIKTGLGWPVYIPPIYPPGLYDLLVTLHSRYAPLGLKRLMITENGTSLRSEPLPDGSVPDDFRIAFIHAHLEQLHAAIRVGVPVDSYFVWTLMDNYEWGDGYRPESAFGLVHIDRTTLRRTPKRSYSWYREVAISNTVPPRDLPF
ncbi:MAG: hypothetical protein RL417_1641 [Pseudomonadota bacterium]|jgi:beta-glucosidase